MLFSSTFLADLDVTARMREHGVPGCSIAVLSGGTVVGRQAYGIRVAGHTAPVTPQTRFQACSISKPVAVFAALRLVDDGVLDLDADVNDALHAWKVPPNGAWQPRISLRQLASHSAGLTTSGFPGYSSGAELPTTLQVLAGVAPANTLGVRVAMVPGVTFRYSGGGITIVQLLLEEATHRLIAELLHDLVLAPLGMQHSTYQQPLPAHLHELAAAAHLSDGSPVDGGWHVYPEQCAAGLWTTPSDLLAFATGVLSAAAGEPGALLSPATAEQMLTPQVPPSPAAERIGSLNALGLGWFLRVENDRTTWFGHTGGNEGYRCHLLVNRETGDGAAVMTNGDGGVRLIAEIFEALASANGWDGYSTAGLAAPPPRGSALDAFTGSFLLPSGGRLVVRRNGDHLLARFGGQPALVFAPESSTELSADDVDATLTLAADGAVVLRQHGADLRCPRA